MSINTNLNYQQNKQYFTFILGDEEYGIDILSVVEIRKLEPMTPLPSAPNFIKGVINLRGTIIPIMDLRERFNIGAIEYNKSTVLIVVQVIAHDQTKKLGIIVDAVSDVYKVNDDQIQSKPEICSTNGHEYISGLVSIQQGKNESKLVILIDVSKLLNLGEFLNLPSEEKRIKDE